MHLRSNTPWIAASSLLALGLALTACTSPSADGEDEAETGETGTEPPQDCADPGSPLFDAAKPVPEPDPSLALSCGTGWGTDAPQRDPSWTAELPTLSSDNGISAIVMEPHPDGGVVVATAGLFARYDADGEQVWSFPGVVPVESQVTMTVEQAGTIILSTYQWSTETREVDRYAADGSLIGPVTIPWNDPQYGDVWALESKADELFIGGWDLDGEGSWENTLLRLDADGNQLLRKSTNTTNSGMLAINDAGTVVFGSFPSFLLAVENGAVQGMLTPSQGGISAVVGFGSEFMIAGSAAGDLSVGRYSAAGVEQWLQTYDRATIGDNGRAVAANADGLVVVGSTQLLSFSNDIYWFNTQPIVFGVDNDGNATWSDRIDAVGDASAVVFGADGEVYVAGLTEGISDGDQAPPQLGWLRRYEL